MEKITNPGYKMLYRVYDKEHKAIADLIACREEELEDGKSVVYIDPQKPWKNHSFENCTFRPLLEPVFLGGKLVKERVSAAEIRNYVSYQLKEEIWEEEQRFVNPHVHYLDMTPDYYQLKTKLLQAAKES